MTSQSKVRDLLITGISTQFPDYNPYSSSKNVQNRSSHPTTGCSFDPHCPECIRDLWGPLLSPFAYLIKQNAEYFDEIIKRIGKYKLNTMPNSSSSKQSLKPPKLEYDDHRFLTTIGVCVYRTSKVGWLITWTLGFLLMILGIAILVLKDSQLSPLIVLLRMNQASRWGLKVTLQLCFIAISLIGILKMLASLLGLIATAHRNQSLMIGTLIFISILILFEIGAVVYCAFARSELMSDIETALTNSFQDHYATLDNDRITDAWDRIFQSYECCGWLINDFSNSQWTSSIANGIPHSCCRPGAVHPTCESILAPPNQNYAGQECSNSIQQSINANAYVPIIFSSIGFIIIIELASTVLTFLYATTLKTASRRRRSHNERSMRKFQGQLASYTGESTNDVPSDRNQTNDLHQLYDPYGSFHQTPPNIDPSFMSLTPTVIQVKRPDVYSYFYYE